VSFAPTFTQGDAAGMTLPDPTGREVLAIRGRAGISGNVQVDVEGVPAGRPARDGTSSITVTAAGELHLVGDLVPAAWDNKATPGIDVTFSLGTESDVEFAWVEQQR